MLCRVLSANHIHALPPTIQKLKRLTTLCAPTLLLQRPFTTVLLFQWGLALLQAAAARTLKLCACSCDETCVDAVRVLCGVCWPCPGQLHARSGENVPDVKPCATCGCNAILSGVWLLLHHQSKPLPLFLAGQWRQLTLGVWGHILG